MASLAGSEYSASVSSEGNSSSHVRDLAPTLETVVVSYQCRELLLRCLESLRRYPPSEPMLVHVVDNDSRDGSVEMVRESFPEVQLHAFDTNAGFSRANNTVLRVATAKYVLLLNPDAEVREGVLDHMLGLMEERPEIGMSGCRLEQPDGTFDHAAKRSFPTPLSALAHFTGIGRHGRAGAALAQYRAPGIGEFEIGEVDSVNGAFMLARSAAIADVGALDEGYWLYMEDLDWCGRFHRRGWKVVYDGTVTALHAKGGASGRHRRWKQNVAFHRGMARFYRKFEGGEQVWLDLAVYAGISVKLAVSAARSSVARGLQTLGSPEVLRQKASRHTASKVSQRERGAK